MKQCFVRLERLALKLTNGTNFQGCGYISEKQHSEFTAGKHDIHVLGDNFQLENSSTLHGESVVRGLKTDLATCI